VVYIYIIMYVYDARCSFILYYIVYIVTGKLKGGLSSYWRCAIKTIPETGVNRSGGLKPIVVYVRVCETFRFWWLAGSIFHRLRVSFKDHRRYSVSLFLSIRLFLLLIFVPSLSHPTIGDDILLVNHPLLPANTVKLINDTISQTYSINPPPLIRHVIWKLRKQSDCGWTKHNNTW